MTNKEQTISNLKKLKSFHNGSYGADIARAIKAIGQEPGDDAISRKDAEQMFRNIRSHLKPQDYKSAEEFNTRDLMLLNAEQMIHALPSVTQEPKTGYWIEHEIENTLKWLECSNCRCETSYNVMHNYCPNCGAKMEVSE